ncbi:hypothetical protein [Rhodococcus sp. IEGM 1351]|uniref:hypothetical protein n=1 Tax=Rhodococcus sp. IEGM 1351 TaxID=3047089 RepID=UPI0024B800C4|nr:hypothetical protein [Rhodococcus sp. IEGM 1351]
MIEQRQNEMRDKAREIAVGRWLKVGNGQRFIVTFYEDGTLNECRDDNPSESWGGSWSADSYVEWYKPGRYSGSMDFVNGTIELLIGEWRSIFTVNGDKADELSGKEYPHHVTPSVYGEYSGQNRGVTFTLTRID